MSIRTRQPGKPAFPSRYQRKADQEWELAGCARQDGDKKAEAEHTAKAREYQRLAAEERE